MENRGAEPAAIITIRGGLTPSRIDPACHRASFVCRLLSESDRLELPTKNCQGGIYARTDGSIGRGRAGGTRRF
jgi:hypothetical protein